MIEINDLYKFVFKVNDGSGICLKFENERKCYILTAYHCIKDSIIHNEKIELLNHLNMPISQKGKSYYSEEKDIALIEIEFIQDLLSISFEEDKILPDDKITFIGYPRKANNKRKRLNGKIIEWNDKKAINIEEHIKGDLTEDEKTIEVFSGFSGSGVFRKRGQTLTLVGLLKSLPEEDFDYKEISCVAIEDIKIFLDDKIFKQQYNIDKEVIQIIKDGKKLGKITIKTVPITMEDGRILNVSIYPVTFKEYNLFCEDMNEKKPHDRGMGKGKKPVINVSWEDANRYCKWLSSKNSKKYRLPTLKEFKNIAIQNTRQYDFEKYIWYGAKKTIEVDSKKIEQGDLGISHIYGNVHEWCQDKIALGGCYSSTNISILKRDNHRFIHKYSYDTVGFRIVLDG